MNGFDAEEEDLARMRAKLRELETRRKQRDREIKELQWAIPGLKSALKAALAGTKRSIWD